MRRTSLSLAVLVVAAPIAAENVPVFTETEFLAAVDTEHPAVVSLSEDLGLAEARRSQAGRLRNPTFDYSREDPRDVPGEITWQVAWAPPLDGRRGSEVRHADAGILAEESRLLARRGRLRLDLRRSYAEWSGWHTRRVILDDHASRLDALVQRMRRRAEAGEESMLDARRLEIASSSSQATLAEAVARETASQSAATSWIGVVRHDLAAGLALRRPELPELPRATGEVDPSLHPDRLTAARRLEQAEAQEKASRRVFLTPELRFGWKTIETATADFDGPVFGLNWTVPIFDRRQGDRLAAKSAVVAARADAEWAAEWTQREALAAGEAYVGLRQAAIGARQELDQLDGLSRAATAAYEHGETGVTDLLDTLRAVRDARLAALDLYLAALAAHRELEFAAGRSLIPGGTS